MKKRLQLMGSLCVLVMHSTFASIDPVSWSLMPATGFPPTLVGDSTPVEYILTSHLPLPVTITDSYVTTGGGLSVIDGCKNTTLSYLQTCAIHIGFNPHAPGNSTFQLTYGYDNNRIPLPTLVAVGSTGPASVLKGRITGLPVSFTQADSPDFTTVYYNESDTDLTGCMASAYTTSGTSATISLPNPPTNCNGILKAHSSCTLDQSKITSATPGTLTVAGHFSCAGPSAVSASPKATAFVKASGGCTVHGHTTLPLPTKTYKFADNVVQFTFENECKSGSATLGLVSLTSSTPVATITTNATHDLCSNKTLAPGEDCTVTASVIPQAVGNLTVTASVTSAGSIASTTTNATVASNIQSKHHILFVNQCKFPVWYGMANGNNANCPGIKCQTPDPNLIKSYPKGAPASAYYLGPQVKGSAPKFIDLEFDSYQNGAIWPRTACTMQGAGQFNCATGTCQTKSNSGTCLSSNDGGTGPIQPQSPYTKIEGDFVPNSGKDGVYDVSVINGMTVPAEIKAFGPSTGNTASTVYNCAAAGAIIQPNSNNNLANCSWNFDPKSTLQILTNNSDFYWVTPGGDNNCAGGVGCGMSYSAYPSSANGNSIVPINRRNGDFLGFTTLLNDTAYTIKTQWGPSRNLFEDYGMNLEIPSHTYGTKLLDGTSIILTMPTSSYNNTYAAYNVLLSIPGITENHSLNSCYFQFNKNFKNCGGCVNWTNTLPAFDCGKGSPNYQIPWNLDWTTHFIPAPIGGYTPQQAIEWLKNACPTAYSYQFDDATSSFQCNKEGATELLTSYQITFCPGGVDALPAGATDGRNTRPS